ncbi:MAG: hypothetical protein Q8O02_00875 [Candidatus Omnitrophota bacterium]|nr:hypothetical protein [Candidatus Omnitrophota bacterium]
MRKPEEITSILFKKDIAPKKARVLNPAFDVTPHQLISGLITDKGIIRPPYFKNISKIFLGK